MTPAKIDDSLILMPSRKTPLVNGEYYHIYNRGVAKMNIFTNYYEFNHFLKTIQYYMIDGKKPKFSVFSPTTMQLDRTRKIIEINTFCLMPNHFHFLIKQLKDGGITEFISIISNSYTKYFNIKNKRVGPLLQGEFHSVHIESNEQLLHTNRYIHLNPTVSFIAKRLEDYSWSSFHEYMGQLKGFCDKKVILDQFRNTSTYRQFLLDQEDYGRKLESIKHVLLDFED